MAPKQINGKEHSSTNGLNPNLQWVGERRSPKIMLFFSVSTVLLQVFHLVFACFKLCCIVSSALKISNFHVAALTGNHVTPISC